MRAKSQLIFFVRRRIVDDFYTACQEKVKNAADPVAAIGELAAISLHDLPRVQICKFVEQATTLLSVIFQTAGNSLPDLTIRFQQIRQQLEATLNYMEQVISAEKDFPLFPQSDDCWW